MTKSEQELIISKLSIIAKAVALGLIRDVSSRERQVELLHLAGFSAAEIAELLGVKYGTVGVMLFNIRQASTKKKAKVARKARK